MSPIALYPFSIVGSIVTSPRVLSKCSVHGGGGITVSVAPNPSAIGAIIFISPGALSEF